MTKQQKWSCIEGCGACCRLNPEEREEAISVLNQEQKKIFFSMVETDGWCRYYNKENRKCTIYNERPDFCNVANMSRIFDISDYNLDNFAINCCKQHIRHVYGGRSKVMRKFKSELSFSNKREK